MTIIINAVLKNVTIETFAFLLYFAKQDFFKNKFTAEN